ncbi:MAG TPA: PIG-L family deacetylase [Gemmatimonadota bacterium]|nr:PIG-L family deacetylase [Gemmatimonadota bacterium]
MQTTTMCPGPSRSRSGLPTLTALAALVLTTLLAVAAEPAAAQEAPYRGLPVEGGAVETGLLLRQLGAIKRVLVIGAHPDDEDSALLAELARHLGARAAYLSLTRGEGGQDLIGSELGKGLGLIRTGELLAARRIDGAEQYFSRAYDFGYSKTAEESFSHWPRDTLLGDMVWVIRTFRPQVIVSIFSGTPADGHGQHQVAGILAREAFDAAADSSRFPEQLAWGARPWRAEKLYRRTWRTPESTTLRVQTGEYDPVLGMSPFQLAMLSRSQHRSQDFGVVRPPGPRYTQLMLLRDLTGAPAGAGLFAGIDTTLAGLADGLPEGVRARAGSRAAAYVAAVAEARDSLRVLDPGAAGGPLRAAVRAIDDLAELARTGGAAPSARAALERQRDLADRALLSAAGVTWRFRAHDDLWVPGETVRVDAEVWNGGASTVRAGRPGLDLPEGWSARLLPADSVELTPSERSGFYRAGAPVKGGAGATTVPPGRLARWSFELEVPGDAHPTVEYFLRRDTVGDLYRWPDDPSVRARPLDPPVATGSLELSVGDGASGVSVRAGSPVRYRGVDKAKGEFWRPVYVVPRLSVAAEPGVLVWPSGDTAERDVTVTLKSQVPDTVHAVADLEVPDGWATRPPDARVELAERGGTESREFRLRNGAAGSGESGAGPAFRTYHLRGVARAAGATGSGAADGSAGTRATGAGSGTRTWSRQLTMIDYPHIDPMPLYTDASVRVERFPVRVDRTRRVGYVMGSGDDVPDAIRQLGLPVTMIGPDRLRSGSFDDFDVIVLGVRAYEVRKDLQAANQRLLDWVRAGGTLIVQYNKYEYVDGGYPPYPATMAHPHDRVTDERAPVKLLHPDAPPLASPNRIGGRDFEGWIQERGLYFLHSWDDRFVPLLSMHDPGEGAKLGSLLVAPLGEGIYVYTGLDFFRELPAGVPGAYRLFANLLSLTPEAWARWAGS